MSCLNPLISEMLKVIVFAGTWKYSQIVYTKFLNLGLSTQKFSLQKEFLKWYYFFIFMTRSEVCQNC